MKFYHHFWISNWKTYQKLSSLFLIFFWLGCKVCSLPKFRLFLFVSPCICTGTRINWNYNDDIASNLPSSSRKPTRQLLLSLFTRVFVVKFGGFGVRFVWANEIQFQHVEVLFPATRLWTSPKSITFPFVLCKYFCFFETFFGLMLLLKPKKTVPVFQMNLFTEKNNFSNQIYRMIWN